MVSIRPSNCLSAVYSNRSITNTNDPLLGLEALETIDRIFIQKVDPTMNFDPPKISVPISRIFKILSISGELILLAGEEVDCGSRCWRGMQRRYTFYIFAPTGEVILSIDRQRIRACDTCPCPSSKEEDSGNDYTDMEILALHDTEVIHWPTGTVHGVLKNCSSVCMPLYQIEDDRGRNVLNIRGGCGGTCCPFMSFRNSNLKLYDSHRNYLGQLQKNVILQDTKGNKNRCMAVNFPENLPIVLKSLLISATLEMKITYFERYLSTTEIIWTILIILILVMSSFLIFFVTVFAMS